MRLLIIASILFFALEGKGSYVSEAEVDRVKSSLNATPRVFVSKSLCEEKTKQVCFDSFGKNLYMYKVVEVEEKKVLVKDSDFTLEKHKIKMKELADKIDKEDRAKSDALSECLSKSVIDEGCKKIIQERL